MSILVSGTLAYDYVMNFPDSFKNHIMPDQLHILNVCFMINKLNKGWGGTAGNIAFTMKMLGGDPIMVSALGRDGEEYLEHFRALGITTQYVAQSDEELTSSAYITTDVDDNQITAFYNGPAVLASQFALADIKEKIDLVLISPTHKEVMKKHLKEASEAGVKAVFDPGQQITAFDETELKQMITQADFVVGNDYEIKLLQERTGWGAKEILANAAVLITTLGGRGSVVSTAAGEEIEVGVCPPRSFDDPTGAGDAYRAGFFTAYLRGHDYKTCGQIGAVAASYAIESYGTQAHRFSESDFAARYEEAFKDKLVW